LVELACTLAAGGIQNGKFKGGPELMDYCGNGVSIINQRLRIRAYGPKFADSGF
jgi:hypothetical protein